MNRDTLRRLLREPLWQFLAIGMLIYLVAQYAAERAVRTRIVIDARQVGALASAYQLQFGAPPASAELDALIERYVKEEIYYREGVAMGLERDDEIVRRRIAQKYLFLREDLDLLRPPTAAQLEAFYRQNANRYLVPARVTFTHVFFSPDRSGAEEARTRAVRELAQLRAGPSPRAPERGDPFPELYDFSAFGQSDLIKVFGDSELAAAPFGAPLGVWSGPYRSGLGWHLILVQARQAPRLPPLGEIAARVRADWEESSREAAERTAFARLREKYRVIRERGHA